MWMGWRAWAGGCRALERVEKSAVRWLVCALPFLRLLRLLCLFVAAKEDNLFWPRKGAEGAKRSELGGRGGRVDWVVSRLGRGLSRPRAGGEERGAMVGLCSPLLRLLCLFVAAKEENLFLATKRPRRRKEVRIRGRGGRVDGVASRLGRGLPRS